LKRTRLTLMLMGVTVALTLLISACGGGDTNTAAPTGGNTTTAPATLGTPGSYNCISGNLTASGSTALQPLAVAVSKLYSAKCTGATIAIQGGGSGAGLTAVKGGNVAIGNSDLYADPTKYGTDLVDHQVAVVVFSVVVNEKVTGVTNLTSDQLKSIFTGKITNWKQVNGPDLAIAPINRPVGSGTRATFEQFVLGTKATVAGANVQTLSSTGEVAKAIGATAGSISYVATSAVRDAANKLTSVAIDGVKDDDANVINNTYKFWNAEHMYTNGAAKQLAQAFIDYMVSADAKATAKTQGFLDITTFDAATLATRKPAGY
jgi:phosphate transport system substrate-binding protein